MATIKKTTLPLKPSVNPKVATTILAKPDAKKAIVSRTSNSVTAKKSASITAKVASDKLTSVKSPTTLKPNPKPVVPSLPKSTVKSSVPAKTATVTSAADSTTSLKSKPIAKPPVKTAAPTVKPISAVKSIGAKPVLKKAQPVATSEVKKAPVAVKSVGLTKSVAEKSSSVAVKSTKAPNTKSFASSTPIKAKTSILSAPSTPTKAKNPITNRVPSSPIAKPTLKLASPLVSKSPLKSSTGLKAPLKSSSALKPVKKPATLPLTKKVRTRRSSLNVNDVIKRLQDESEIVIRDADSTTLEEERNEEFLPIDNEAPKLCQCDENENFKKESEAVDEQRVYAVAEQLIGVMQPEELEVITADVAEQRTENTTSCVINMSASETAEPVVETVSSVDENIQQDSLNEPATVVKALNDQVPVSEETESITPADEHEILDMYERKVQELTDIYRGTVEVPVFVENSAEISTEMTNEECENNSCTNISKNEVETDDAECAETIAKESVDEVEDCVNESLMPVADTEIDVKPCEDLIPTTVEEETELENNPPCDSKLTAAIDIEFSNEIVEAESTVDIEKPDISNAFNDGVSGDQTETEVEQASEESQQESENFQESFNLDNPFESSGNFTVTLAEYSLSSYTEEITAENIPMLINLELDVDETVDNEIFMLENHFCDEKDVPACFSEDSFAPTYPTEDTFTIPPQNSIIDSELINITADHDSFHAPETGEDSNITSADDYSDMSYAEAVQSLKILTSDILKNESHLVEDAVEMMPVAKIDQTSDDVVESMPVAEIDQSTAETADSGMISADVPSVISVYDAAEFPESVPSDEHYEKQDHEADQHDESFHKIRHKRNKRRNKKNRKSSNAEIFDDHSTSPKNVHNERHQNYEENCPVEYHGRRRNSRRWRNSRSYYEAFHQHQPHNQEYYADPHWKFTPKMD